MDRLKHTVLIALAAFTCLLTYRQAYGFVSVPPERPVRVEMSSSDINRVVCVGGDIKDVVYSKEKGLTVKVLASDAFIKFPVVRKGADIVYADQPSEVYIACGETVYSIIVVPKKIPPVTIQLEDGTRKLKKNISLFKGLAFEEKVLRLIRYAYIEEFPDTLTVEVQSGHSAGPELGYGGLDISLRKKVVVEGEGLQLYEYVIIPGEDMELRDVDFMPLAERPVAIALESAMVSKGKKYRLFIVDYPLMENKDVR